MFKTDPNTNIKTDKTIKTATLTNDGYSGNNSDDDDEKYMVKVIFPVIHYY